VAWRNKVKTAEDLATEVKVIRRTTGTPKEYFLYEEDGTTTQYEGLPWVVEYSSLRIQYDYTSDEIPCAAAYSSDGNYYVDLAIYNLTTGEFPLYTTIQINTEFPEVEFRDNYFFVVDIDTWDVDPTTVSAWQVYADGTEHSLGTIPVYMEPGFNWGLWAVTAGGVLRFIVENYSTGYTIYRYGPSGFGAEVSYTYDDEDNYYAIVNTKQSYYPSTGEYGGYKWVVMYRDATGQYAVMFQNPTNLSDYYYLPSAVNGLYSYDLQSDQFFSRTSVFVGPGFKNVIKVQSRVSGSTVAQIDFPGSSLSSTGGSLLDAIYGRKYVIWYLKTPEWTWHIIELDIDSLTITAHHEYTYDPGSNVISVTPANGRQTAIQKLPTEAGVVGYASEQTPIPSPSSHWAVEPPTAGQLITAIYVGDDGITHIVSYPANTPSGTVVYSSDGAQYIVP
jgi:hypothetical protein